MIHAAKAAASLVAVCLAVSEVAAINMDATFDPGAMPSDFGWIAAGSFDPAANVAAGVWNSDVPAGVSSVWSGNGTGVASTVVGPLVYGFSEIQVLDFGLAGDANNRTAFGLFRNDVALPYGFLLYFNPGHVQVIGSGLGHTAEVPNQDGLFHRYGWELDEPNRTIKLFFDDVQVGFANGYTMTGNFAGDTGTYFGDGSDDSAHHDVWTRVVVAEGAYPVDMPIPGDVNDDGFVDIFDVNVVSANWGTTGPTGDANGDMMVDIFDVNVISANWSLPPAQGIGATVPEPTGAALGGIAFAIAGVMLARRSRSLGTR